MDSGLFIDKCKEVVLHYANRNAEDKITSSDVYVVWSTKVLQNNKALLSTSSPDGMYYEITYNGDKKEFYFDAYKREKNVAISIESMMSGGCFFE